MLTETLDAQCDPDLSLVMPCYNEEAIVSHTISRLLSAFTKAGYRLEIVAVDNGSADRTGEILRRLAASNPAVLYHRVELNEGYGKGVLSGLPLANAPWVGIIPADGQVDAEDVVRLYNVVHGTDSWVVAKVRRRFRLDGLLRKFVSTSYNLLFRILWPTVGSIDINGSPKIMPREAFPAMGLKSKQWFLDPEIMIKSHALRMRVIEFNVFARLRGDGVSHVKAGTCWEFFWNLMEFRLGGRWKHELVRDRSAAAARLPANVKS
jgi:glycosyltransferase involved in cell wall biosynthesis